MMSTTRLACFKTYDIRGKVPQDLNPELAHQIARAYAEVLQPKTVAVGYDMRLSSAGIAEAVIQGLLESGVDVHELGLCGTEEVYFAAAQGPLDGGIMITASHNPAEYNGMKMVAAGARPVNSQELEEIEQKTRATPQGAGSIQGKRLSVAWRARYVDSMVVQFPPERLARLKTVLNAGNGAVGPLLDALRQRYDWDLTILNGEPDGTFPNGVPNPLLPEKRAASSEAVRAQGAQLGIAWDGDFDRCFFFDSRGDFVESYYLVGLFAKYYLSQGHKGIAYDPRLTWNTEEIVARMGGQAILCNTGHIYFKQKLRETGAAYGGEMSGHHYFQDFGCCDSGIYPWFLYLALQQQSDTPLEDELRARAALFPISGEINSTIANPKAALDKVAKHFRAQATRELSLDGVSMEFSEWRYNLRMSNTEPLVRLNVESRARPDIVRERTAEILSLLAESS